MQQTIHTRTAAFCDDYDLSLPILLAPMAGACPPQLSAAVIKAGGLGACGALLMEPAAIQNWAAAVRSMSDDRFQLNIWIPDPPARRDLRAEVKTCDFLTQWGPPVPPEAGDTQQPDFDAQCDAMLEARPNVMSSIMGLYPPHVLSRMKSLGIRWFATVTSVTEALAAEQAGADAIIAQGMEAGGHRGVFIAADAERQLIGLFSLLPAVVDAVRIPVVAAGGISDGRGIAAALVLGASAVQIGTGFLRTPEAALPTVWADAIGRTLPEQTITTRAFSGRLGRSIATTYAVAAGDTTAPPPAPFPIQRALTQAMRDDALKRNDITGMQAWAGQSAALAQAKPAAELTHELWASAQQALKNATLGSP